MERAGCVWSPLHPQEELRVRVYSGTGPARSTPLTLVLSPLCKGRGDKGVCGAFFQLQRAHKNDEPAVSLHAKKTHPYLRLLEPWACRGEPLYCGKRLMPGVDAVRISIVRRSAFKRLTGFKRPAGSTRLECLELCVIFEAGIVIFPPGPGTAPSSSESKSSELVTLIALSIFFPVVTVLPTGTFPPVATGEGGGRGILVLAAIGEAPNGG